VKTVCPSCGAKQRRGAAFCRFCGAKLPDRELVEDDAPTEPRSTAPGPPSLRTSFQLLWLALGSYFVLLAANLGLILGGLDLDQLRWLQSAMLVAALLAMQLASHKGTIPSLRAFVSLPKLNPRLVGELVLGMVVALAAAGLLGLMIPMLDSDLMHLYRNNGDSMRAAFLDMSVIAPLLEETVFRGIVLGALRPLVTPRGALWTSSLMFAALHLTPLTFVHHTLLGYICGRARLETKSMLPPVVIHAAYNAIVVLLSW
jgi:membrane protease YdiL (CAAX protease family)